MKRKLVTIRTIDSITPNPNADRLETAHVGGWAVVVGKGEFQEGQKVLFHEIDSMCPLKDCPFQPDFYAFLEPRGAKEYKGGLYHRLKTAKLRGQISQGLIMSIPEGLDVSDPTRDFSEDFGVIKYEIPLPEELKGLVKPFPGWLSKTDEERVQNLEPEFLEAILAERENFIATEKLDGTSCTIFAKDIGIEGHPMVGVCSRNYQITDINSPFRKIATTPLITTGNGLAHPWHWLASQIVEKGHSSAVLQGELIGENIQKNPLKREGKQFWIFNLMIDGHRVPYEEVQDKYHVLLDHWVPVYETLSLPNSVDAMVAQVDGLESKLAPGCQAEGIVWRHKSKPELKAGDEMVVASFKCINNSYLLKHDG